MYAAESNAPEGRDAQAPDLRGGCVYGHGPRRCGAAAPMGRGETPGPRGEAKRLADAALRLRPLPLHRAGVVGILCAGGFPARAAPGARIIPNSPPRRAEARKAGRPAARGTAGKNFLKKVLDTAERAR